MKKFALGALIALTTIVTPVFAMPHAEKPAKQKRMKATKHKSGMMKMPMVGGAAMYPTKTIVENASTASNLTTLVTALKAADLVETLSGPGPFTVFAPTNDAFAKLPAGTVDMLAKPENKATVTSVLTYHVLPGKLMSTDIAAAIKAGGGKAMVTTLNGGQLTASMMGGKLMLTDAKGGMSMVSMADVKQSNGVVHVIDTVVMP
jgi:uncharacterized surface protein with fasciclin (FAS1) repeats